MQQKHKPPEPNMHAKRTSQMSIFDQFAAHESGLELKGMSEQLDAHPEWLDFVANDLGSSAVTGRCRLRITVT